MEFRLSSSKVSDKASRKTGLRSHVQLPFVKLGLSWNIKELILIGNSEKNCLRDYLYKFILTMLIFGDCNKAYLD